MHSNKNNSSDNKFDVSGLAGQDADKFIEGTWSIKIKEDVLQNVSYNFAINVLLQSQFQPYKNFEGNLKEFIAKVNNILADNYTETLNFKVSVRAEKLLISLKEAEIDPSTIISVDFIFSK